LFTLGVSIELKFKDIFRSYRGWWPDYYSNSFNLCTSKRSICRFRYLPDLVGLISLSVLLCKSHLLAEYLGVIVNRHRNVPNNVRSVKNIIGVLFNSYLSDLDYSLRISVRGKMAGQKKRRFRNLIIMFGKTAITSLKKRISYNLVQTFNIYGSFSVKV